MNTRMELTELTEKEKQLFSNLAKAYAHYDIPILMADHVPQRGGVLSEFVDKGGRAYIAGGKDGQQFFKNVPQYTLNFDTFCTRDKSSIDTIAACFPPDIVNGKFATFSYTPQGDRLWTKGIQSHLGGMVVASNEQNFREYFEEKTNLADILSMAGLSKHIIPSTIIRHNKPLSDLQAKIMYEKYRSKDGKIVIQECGEGNDEKGGGHSTEIIDNYEDFKTAVSRERLCYLKVARFITGCNSNLSICVGNTIPNKDMFGAVKGELLPSESRFTRETLENLYARGKMLGLNDSNIIVNVQPGTLKVVGAPQLTSGNTNGVGNQLNFNFSPEIMEEVYQMGMNLGTFMAKCGKVGLCGLDLIITKDGSIYVNELNDRQQGPTESASLNNEEHGLPGIHRESFLLNYADLNNREVVDYLYGMKGISKELYYESSKIPSPFYIKVCALGDSYVKTDVQPGDYRVTRQEDGNYTWDLGRSYELETLPDVDVRNSEFTVRINTVSAKEGDFFPEGSQFLRINGVATPDTAPFSINDEGVSVLTEKWEAPIKALYEETLAEEKQQTSYSFTQEEMQQYADSHPESDSNMEQEILSHFEIINQDQTHFEEQSNNVQ